jgi:hypothetical protein
MTSVFRANLAALGGVLLRSRTLLAFAPLALSLFVAQPAQAFGFGAGLELGGHVGFARLASGGLGTPSLFGGGPALLLSLELYDENFIRVQTLGRLSGNGFTIVSDAGGGAGGGGGGELLLRVGAALPVFSPFFEVGAGAEVGGGAGTASVESIGAATENARAGAMWAPGGWVGIGGTFQLPLLPYVEARLGTHVGYLVPLDASPPLALTGIDALSLRAEAYLGAGYRF